MFPSLNALLLRTLVIDLHAKNQHNTCKGIENVWKTVPSVKLTKSEVVIPRKNNEVQRNLSLICRS